MTNDLTRRACDRDAPLIVLRCSLSPSCAVLMRSQSQTTVSNESRKKPRHKRDHRECNTIADYRQHRCANHDDHEPCCSQRCQPWPNPQESGKNQAEPAEHFAHADKLDKKAWQDHLVG